jgi:1-acyl-sn-glycerol-3-phosphate acyltransferase
VIAGQGLDWRRASDAHKPERMAHSSFFTSGAATRLTHARGVRRLVGLGARTLGWVGLATAHQQLVPDEERTPVFQYWLRYWARSLVTSCGGEVTLTPGSVVPPQTRARLVVSNHRSPFDIGVLLGLFGGHPLSRADLADWPVLGMAATRAGAIFVDREDAGSGASAIRAIRSRLQGGASILVFPEGGTFEGDEVRPFKGGALAAVRGLDVDVVPVGIAYDPGAEYVEEGFVDHVLRVAQRPRTRIVVEIGTPRRPEGKTATLAAALRDDVQRLVDGARAHWRTLGG